MPVGEHNLARLADEARERLGDRESLFFEGRWYRSGELHQRVRRVGAGLVDLGVQPGERVVIFMANTPEVGITYNAIWRAGAVATPAIFLLPPDELRHVLADSGATTVVTTPEFLSTVNAARDGLAHVERVVCVGGGADTVAFDDLEDADPGSIVARDDDDLAALLYTGGTTGRSKGVMLTHANLWHTTKSAMDAAHVPGITRTIVPLPLSHAYGLGVSVMAGHQPEPGTSVLMRWFDPAGFLDLVEQHEIQRATLVPAMVQLLLAQPLEDRDLSSLSYVGTGAAPLADETAEEFERRAPGVAVLQGYGCTESSTFVSMEIPSARRRGTVGRPIPGVGVRIVDDEGEDVPPGQPGEVIVRSAGVMPGYWNDPQATEAALRDGWLRTGDVGALDEDGFLRIVDRKKDVIIRGGFNVYPRDVEDALVEHPAIATAGVVGAPDPDKGEEVVAFVTLDVGSEVDGDAIVAWAKARLGGYRYPRRVEIVDQLPTTPVLKLDRKALRQLL